MIKNKRKQYKPTIAYGVFEKIDNCGTLEFHSAHWSKECAQIMLNEDRVVRKVIVYLNTDKPKQA